MSKRSVNTTVNILSAQRVTDDSPVSHPLPLARPNLTFVQSTASAFTAPNGLSPAGLQRPPAGGVATDGRPLGLAIAILGASVNRCHYVPPGEHGAMALLALETHGRPLGWPLIQVDHLPAEYGPGWPLRS